MAVFAIQCSHRHQIYAALDKNSNILAALLAALLAEIGCWPNRPNVGFFFRKSSTVIHTIFRAQQNNSSTKIIKIKKASFKLQLKGGTWCPLEIWPRSLCWELPCKANTPFALGGAREGPNKHRCAHLDHHETGSTLQLCHTHLSRCRHP